VLCRMCRTSQLEGVCMALLLMWACLFIHASVVIVVVTITACITRHTANIS
jgi:hypothetical protein